VALPAVLLSLKVVLVPTVLLLMVALPAELLLLKVVVPPVLLVILALPAVLLFENCVTPPLLLMKMELAAVLEPVRLMVARLGEGAERVKVG